jgi:hypothetical protein
MMNPETEQRFDYIRTTFFPRWDRAHKWTVGDKHADCQGYGYCDTEGKQIIVKPDSPHGQDVTLIHEITHAVASIYHGKKWRRRMEKAAQKAESLRLRELADGIREECTDYRDKCIKPTATMVYNQVEDAVRDKHGERSFEKVVEFVADSNGMTSKTLLAKYKRLRKVYHNAVSSR